MIIDLHIHEKRNSDDSVLSLEEAVVQARKMGLDAICITDHDNHRIRDFAKEYSKKAGYPIFVGAEIYTEEGDFVVFGLKEIPEETLSAQELLDLVEKEGGVAIAAHPYRNTFRSLGDWSYSLEGFWAVEAYNGTTSVEKNQQAGHMAKMIDMPMVGASDAHRIEHLGRCATYFTTPVTSEEDLIRAIKERQVYPVEYTGEGYRPIQTTKDAHKKVHAASL